MDKELIAELNDWYAGRKVFVTGHTGFKGAWLTAWLVEAGAIVTGYALAPDADAPNLFRQSGLESRIDSRIADICDGNALTKALNDSEPEIVFHLAAQSLVRQSYVRPVETYRTNVLGTVQLLDTLRNSPAVKAVVIVTSDKCYENRNTPTPYVEEDPMGGADPYSSSKGCAEIATSAFRRSFFSNGFPAVASARAGNVIGGGDWADDRLVPDIIKASRAGGTAVIRNPTAVRPWQFVLEPLRGYLMLGSALVEHGQDFASAWNFGPRENDGIAVGDLANRVASSCGVALRNETQENAPHEAALLKIDSAKAAANLNWHPAISLDRAIDLTVAGYKAFGAHENVLPQMTNLLNEYWKDVDVAA